MGSLIIGLLVLIFVVGPILWAIADEDIHRANKKIDDYYKEREKQSDID